jgi:hypothetical protein
MWVGDVIVNNEEEEKAARGEPSVPPAGDVKGWA